MNLNQIELIPNLDEFLTPVEIAQLKSTFYSRFLADVYRLTRGSPSYFSWNDTDLTTTTIVALYSPVRHFSEKFPPDVGLATLVSNHSFRYISDILKQLSVEYPNDRRKVLLHLLLHFTQQYLDNTDIAPPINFHPGAL